MQNMATRPGHNKDLRSLLKSFSCSVGSILWFDPRREHSSVPTVKSHSRRAQGLSRLAASSRPPAGLGLDWPEHGGTLDRIGAGGCRNLRPGGGLSSCRSAPPCQPIHGSPSAPGVPADGRADAAEADPGKATRMRQTSPTEIHTMKSNT